MCSGTSESTEFDLVQHRLLHFSSNLSNELWIDGPGGVGLVEGIVKSIVERLLGRLGRETLGVSNGRGARTRAERDVVVVRILVVGRVVVGAWVVGGIVGRRVGGVMVWLAAIAVAVVGGHVCSIASSTILCCRG